MPRTALRVILFATATFTAARYADPGFGTAGFESTTITILRALVMPLGDAAAIAVVAAKSEPLTFHNRDSAAVAGTRTGLAQPLTPALLLFLAELPTVIAAAVASLLALGALRLARRGGGLDAEQRGQSGAHSGNQRCAAGGGGMQRASQGIEAISAIS